MLFSPAIKKLAVGSNLTCPCVSYPSELSGVLHQCHILASEMVHFIHQMQYYITFEVRPLAVLPLSWAVKHQQKVAITEAVYFVWSMQRCVTLINAHAGQPVGGVSFILFGRSSEEFGQGCS